MRTASILYITLIAALIIAADFNWIPHWPQLHHKVPNIDKLLHFVLIGFLAVSANILCAFRSTRLISIEIFNGSLIVFLIITLEEFSQTHIELRTFSWADLLANFLGIIMLGELLSSLLSTRKPKEKSQNKSPLPVLEASSNLIASENSNLHCNYEKIRRISLTPNDQAVPYDRKNIFTTTNQTSKHN